MKQVHVLISHLKNSKTPTTVQESEDTGE